MTANQSTVSYASNVNKQWCLHHRKGKKREKNVVSATKARWVIKKQSAQISEEHYYANAGRCNATSSLSLNLPDLNNIVVDEEVDDVNADTDDSDDCESKHSSMPWDSGRRVVELGVLANALASCKNCTNPLQLSHATSIRTYGLAAILKVGYMYMYFITMI